MAAVTGFGYSYSDTVSLYWLNLAGDTLRTKRLYHLQQSDSGYCGVRASVRLGQGGFVLAGFESRSAIDTSVSQVLLLRTTNLGDTLWSKVFGQLGREEDVFAIAEYLNEGFLLAGYSLNATGTDRCMPIRTDSLGNRDLAAAVRQQGLLRRVRSGYPRWQHRYSK